MPAIVIPAPISSNHAAPVSAGGTGATTAAAARTNLDVYSKSEVTNAISQSTANRMLYVDASLTFTNDSSSAKEYEIPLSSYIPSGYVIQGVAACVKSGTAYYVLPWSNNALTQYLNIQRITGTSVWLRNKSDGWGTVTVRLSVAIGKT